VQACKRNARALGLGTKTDALGNLIATAPGDSARPSGTLTHWIVDQFTRDLDPKTAMAQLAAEAAASPPGANGLVALPYFSGERTPIHNTHAKGAVLGLTLAQTRAEAYRAIIEGIAFATNHILETYADAAAAPSSIRAVGGGLRNPLWTQATSDVAGRIPEVRKIGVGASYGDAFLASVAIGDVTKEAIEAWTPPCPGSSQARQPQRFTGGATRCSASSILAPAT